MSGLKIVAADNIKGSGLDMLRDHFGADAVEARGKFDEDELLAKIGEMDALLIRSGTTVTKKAIDAASDRLKIIGRAGVGTDNIDKAAATERGIIVMNTPLGNTVSAAEQAITLLFASARNLARADRNMQAGKWLKKELTGSEVFEKTLGLIGMGKIGSHVAKVMRAAGMKVIAYDPYLSADRARQMGVDPVELEELFKVADFISIHTPLTDQTRNMIDAKSIATMKKGVRLVNCARGGIVNEVDLAEAVKSGHVAAAGIDVFSNEPMTEGPLFGVDDLTLTPHLGASTEEATERCGVQMAEQVIAYFDNGEIINGVNIQLAADKSLGAYVDIAYAMGRIGATLLNTAPEKVEIACSGKLEEKDTGSISNAAVRGVLAACGAEGINVVNAGFIAKQRGIAVSETSLGDAGHYVSRVDVIISGGGKECRLGGTAYNDVSPRIIQLDDAQMDIRLSDHMIFLRYPDRPGYVGKFGTIIANHGINIANMEVGCLESRQRASMVLGLSDAAPADIIEKLLAVDGVERAYVVNLV